MDSGKDIIIEKELSFSKISVRVSSVGADYVIVVQGGSKAHIGGCVLAVPRPSLTGDGNNSCTVSVINVIGHKDEEILRVLAEARCRASGAVVTCTGGFHLEHITEEQIREVQEAAAELAERLRQTLW